jgi:hypothetical protein
LVADFSRGKYLKRRPHRPGEPIDDLLVIKEAKDLCAYVFEVTDRSPVKFRFTFTSKMQGYCLDILENLYLANELYIGPGCRPADVQERRGFQQHALARIKLLATVAEIACDRDAILPKQFAQMGKMTTSCQRLLAGWIASDHKRLASSGAGTDWSSRNPRERPAVSDRRD